MIVVVRHGRTLSNASGLLLGRADPSLDDVGRSQARQVAAAVGKVDRVVTSPLARARQTAAEFDLAGGQVEIDKRFIELDYGEWDERPVSDVTSAEWARWRADIGWAPPGGESLAALGERVRSGLDELVSAAEVGTVVVVTHVSPVKAALAWALGVGDEVSWRSFVQPASITRIGILRGVPQLLAFNDVAHCGP